MLQTVTYSSTATLKVRKLSNSSDFKLQSSRERKQIRPQSSLEKNYKCPFGPITLDWDSVLITDLIFQVRCYRATKPP